jgi:ABC-type polysaccharide/polyol phosphate export permease
MAHWAHRQELIPKLAELAVEACAVKFWRKRPSGLLSLLAAALDPFLYAVAAYLVVANVFGREGIARFHLIALGFVTFRWTVGCLMQSVNLEPYRARYAELSRHPFSAALVTTTAPPTLAFALSLLLAVGGTLAFPGIDRSWQTFWMLPAVIAVQGVWNLVLTAATALAWRRGYLRSEIPLISAAVLVWFFSPVMYLLGDVPSEASRLFTSLNPVSHVIAAYHNVYWYGHPLSLTVLPLSLLCGATLLFALSRTKTFSAPNASLAPALSPTDTPLTLIVLQDGAPRLGITSHDVKHATQQRFSRWQTRPRDITGSGMVRMLLIVGGYARKDREAALRGVEQESRVGRLFDSDLTLYPDAMIDQLAFCAAMGWSHKRLVLDGLLNTATPEFVERAWRRLEAETARGRHITVISDHALPLPRGGRGRIKVIGPSGTIADHQISRTNSNESIGQGER